MLDAQGRFVAHDAHVLSMKDNNQSLNLAPLIDAGVRSGIEAADCGSAEIATQMVLTLVEPQSSGIGGGGFIPAPVHGFRN